MAAQVIGPIVVAIVATDPLARAALTAAIESYPEVRIVDDVDSADVALWDGDLEGTPNPDLSIVKTASISDSAEFTVGREITYSFVITNTGDVTLTDVHPNEKSFTGSGPMSDPVCEDGATSLAPGTESWRSTERATSISGEMMVSIGSSASL